ncbi:MAG: VWA domain-containing protein [Myxococcales bacterium]|nr:VWA domain-containing protein [Myxococcales bacterium]
MAAQTRRGHARGLSLAGALSVGLIAGCFTGTYLEGKSCSDHSECGPQLDCINGFCGGVMPGTTEAPGTDSDTSTTDATASGSESESETSTTTDEPTTDTTTATTETETTDSTLTDTSTTDTTETTGPSCSCEALDILVVIDQSASMEDYEDKVIAVFFELVQVLEDALADICDYHIGFTFASEIGHNPNPCKVLGSLLTRNADQDCAAELMAGRPYVTQDDDVIAALFCLAMAGSTKIEGEDNARIGDVLRLSVSPEFNAPDGCNDGFFRPEAPLVTLIISDVDDDLKGSLDGYGSQDDPGTWYADIFMANNFNSEGLTIAALIGPEEEQMGCGAGPTPRLHEFLGYFVNKNVLTANICDDEMTLTDEFVASIGGLFSAACE